MIKTKDIKNLSSGELQTKLKDTRQEYLNLRFQVITGQLTDTSRLKITRRMIARYESILRERELAEKEGTK
jgi:large subunit ribosomal protein L29